MVPVSPNNFTKWILLLFVCLTALVLAHLEIIENGFVLPEKYLFPFSAFAVNVFYIGIALLLFQGLITYLDQKIPWSKDTKTRFFIQLGISLVAYLIIQYLIIYGIEPVFNQNESTPIRILFTFIIGFVLTILLNLVYLFIYLNQRAKMAAPTLDLANFLQGTAKGKKIALPTASFLLFYIEAGIIFGHTEDHQKIILKESLADLEKILDTQQFFRANRKELIAKKAIDNVEFGMGGTTKVSLHSPMEEVVISRRRSAAFRKWLKA